MSLSINTFLTSELDDPQYPLLFAEYFQNREDYIQRKAALIFFGRSLCKNIDFYDLEHLQEIAEVIEDISLNIINQENGNIEETTSLLNLLPKSIIKLFSIVGLQWEGFFRIITLYEDDIVFFDFCANLISELLDLRSDQDLEIIHQFGIKLIQFGILSESFDYFFPSFKILLKSPILDELSDCYQKIFQVANDSLTLFKNQPSLLQEFWGRMSNFRISSENDRDFALIAIEFLGILNSSIKDESSPFEYNPSTAEVFIYYLCSHIDVLIEEDEVQLLLKSYVKLMKYLLAHSSNDIRDNTFILMKLFYLNCSPEQLNLSVSYFMYKINKYIFTESNEDGEENEQLELAEIKDPNLLTNCYLIGSYLFIDILSYHAKAALPYISSHFIPLIDKMVENAIEGVYEVFSYFVCSSICNEIDYYDFFDKILDHLFTGNYMVRSGCYDVIISFGVHMNYLSGFIFPLLIQNIDDVHEDEFHVYLNCLYATFNPSLNFSDENSSTLYDFFESLIQSEDENITLKAALFVFKLMIMHSHIFSPLFPASLEILIDNPEDNRIYIAFKDYIKYFGIDEIEDSVHDLFYAANASLDNEERFSCVTSLLKYVPDVRKTEEADQFYRSIIDESDFILGEAANLEMISHVIFEHNYFVKFFCKIHRKIRTLNSPRKELLYGFCKISRKMLKNIPERVSKEDITRVVETSFKIFLLENANQNMPTELNTESDSNFEEEIGCLMEDTKFIIQNSNTLAEFGMMLAMLEIERVHIVTEMFLNLSTSGDYEVLYYSMNFFEKVLKCGQASEDEISELVQFSIAGLEGIRVDIHLNQLINLISALPREIIISDLFENLLEFYSSIQPSAKDFQCAISNLSALLVNLMGKVNDLFEPQIACDCLEHFPPFERNKTISFLEGIIAFASNDFPDEIKSKANSCILEYLSWNPNRTKFYKISDEMDSFIISNFLES